MHLKKINIDRSTIRYRLRTKKIIMDIYDRFTF